MARSDPLNAKQMGTLKLIASGEDLSAEQHIPLRITARALQSRGLVRVHKQKKLWRAEVTDEGRYYLEHGHKRSDSGGPSSRSRGLKARQHGAQLSIAKQPSWIRPARKATVSSVSATRRADAEAMVERLRSDRHIKLPDVSEAEHVRWRRTVDFAKRHGLVPQGNWIERSRGYDGSVTIRLIAGEPSNLRRSKSDDLPAVPVPEKSSRLHPVVARLRDDSDCLRMSKDLRKRGLWLLQALAAELMRRGHRVVDRPAERRYYHPYHSPRHQREGRLGVEIDGFSYTITIDQEFPQSEDPVRSNSLTLSVSPNRGMRRAKWADRKTARLESWLPAAIQEVELLAVDDRRQAIAEEKAKAERRVRWEQAMSEAKDKAVQAHYAQALIEVVESWQRYKTVVEYCAALETLVEKAPPGHADLESAKQWRDWARTYADSINPLTNLPTMPSIPEIRPEDLKPFLSGWSPYGSESHNRGW